MNAITQDFAPSPTLEWLGHTYRTLISTQETAGGLCVLETTSPAGSGPARHVHASEDEAFVILKGEVEFWVAGQTLRRGPGEAAFVPRGTEHTLQALTEARMVVILTPGGFEGFFADMARGAFRIPEDMAAVVESGVRHNLTFTGPPL